MTAPDPLLTHPTFDVVPPPVLFNAWKHHAGWIGIRIASAGGEAGLDRLAAELVVVGTRLMDLYVGPLAPTDIAGHVLDQLRAAGREAVEPFRAWLEGQGGYAVLTLPADGSRWAVRLGTAGGRYVHLHPGRYSPHTVRVQANPLKTAVMAHALAGVAGGASTDVAVVNAARKRYLGLPPVRAVAPEGGLGKVIGLLDVR